MGSPRTTVRRRLDLAKSALSKKADLEYRDALAFHHQSAGIVDHMVQVTGKRASRSTAAMLTALTLLYNAQHRAAGLLVDIGGPREGISAHFLRFVVEMLPEEPRSGALRALAGGTYELWQSHNPGVVPEPCVFGRMAHHAI